VSSQGNGTGEIESRPSPEPMFPGANAGGRREFVLLLDAIRQLVLATRLHYRRIQEAAIYHGRLSDEPETQGAEFDEIQRAKTETHVAIVADVGALIGTIHRLRSLVKRLPGGKETRLAKRAFVAEVKDLEEARHQLEHLDTAIAQISGTGEGAFGAVSWWERLGDGHGRWVAFFPGTMAEGAQAVSRRPSVMRSRVDHVWASIAGRNLNVSEAYLAVVRLEERLREWGMSQDEGGWPCLAAE